MSLIWVVDDDASIRFVVERALASEQREIRSFESLNGARTALQNSCPDVLITDIRLKDGNGLSLLDQMVDCENVQVIVMTAYGNLNSAVAAYQGGAFEYLAKPFDIDALREAVERALRYQPAVRDETSGEQDGMLGQSTSMQELFRHIGRLSTTDVSVLITGETGAGKELVAKALHRHSPRSHQPFVAINSAAVPTELLESELFGHEKGAFTGATQRHIGRFEQAQKGTLFLDEIGDMPLALQTRLLRVLAEGDYYRVGGRDLLTADVRIIAATHQDLAQRVERNEFRADLYHRLNVIHIRVPPLRERQDDIALLANHFLRECVQELGVDEKSFSPESLAILRQLPWPGNVRELRNLCQHLSVMAPGQVILPSDLPAEYQLNAEPVAVPWQELLQRQALQLAAKGDAGALEGLRREVRELITRSALQASKGKIGAAAQILGVGRNTLTRWLKETETDTNTANSSKAD